WHLHFGKAFLLSLFLGFLGADRFYLGFFYSALPGIDLSAWLAAQCLPPSDQTTGNIVPPTHPPTHTHARTICLHHSSAKKHAESAMRHRDVEGLFGSMPSCCFKQASSRLLLWR
ncbi:unnamed protein product, partial [Effrenium voratum]